MFIIKQLIEKENEIISTYSEFIRKFDVESKNSAQFVERIEELRKFLMSVSSIKILMNFSKTVDLWILDFAETMNIDNASMILSETAKKNYDRIDLIKFILKNKVFLKSMALDENEVLILKNALEMCG